MTPFVNFRLTKLKILINVKEIPTLCYFISTLNEEGYNIGINARQIFTRKDKVRWCQEGKLLHWSRGQFANKTEHGHKTQTQRTLYNRL